jgi:transcriptional regulator with XRE-family HTH domain
MAMAFELLKQVRLQRGHTQEKAAAALGVTQAYFSMLESGVRTPSLRVARKMMDVYGLPPTILPVAAGVDLRLAASGGSVAADTLAYELASLDYPGFAHLRRSGVRRVNPAQYLLLALSQNDLEARVAEALPWLVYRYPEMDFSWLVPQARVTNLQNRLGFTVALARTAAQNLGQTSKKETLDQEELALAESKLVKEDSYCRVLNEAEKRWLRENRSAEARSWNLLTDLRSGSLRYVNAESAC